MDTDITPLTRANLAQLFNLGSLALLDPPPGGLYVAPDPDLVTIFTAESLGWMVEHVELSAMVGRFALVEYTPAFGLDPDLLIVLATGPAAEQFRLVAGSFQAHRRRYDLPPNVWYRQAKILAREFVGPLWALEPTRQEAAFVARWLLLTVAQGRQIIDGIPGDHQEQQPIERPAKARDDNPPDWTWPFALLFWLVVIGGLVWWLVG